MKALLAPLAIAIIALSWSAAARAQHPYTPIGQLCAFVSARSPDRNPDSPHDFAYQTSLYRGASVDLDRDDVQEVRRKMQVWWDRYGQQVNCNAVNFNVPNGNILKFAVSRRFDDFINDVADWGVNLNYVDRTDNRTVLDYIEDEIVRLDGTAAERTLRRYYRTLRDAGALHRRELRQVIYTGDCPDCSSRR